MANGETVNMFNDTEEQSARNSTPSHSIAYTMQLADEVEGFLKAMRFDVTKETWEDGRIAFQARRKTMGQHIHRWFLCLERGVAKEDVEKLHEHVKVASGSSGWIVTDFPIDSNAQRLIETQPSIAAHNLANFYREMLQYDSYLVKLIKGSQDINKYWVDLECSVGDDRGRFEAVEYVDKWLGKPTPNQLALLGLFGTGKTWFCRYYAARLAKQHLKNPGRHRIPILISLQGYAKALNIGQLVTDTLVNTYDMDFGLGGFEAFMHLNRCGRLLLIFDGFDGMEQRVEYGVALKNYEEISRTVVGSSKVILTSRPLFFEDRRRLEEILKNVGNTSVQGTDVTPEQKTEQLRYRSTLRELLATHFNDQELRTLCFDLGVDYDHLAGEGTGDKARELVAYSERRSCVDELVKVGKGQRPDVPWEDPPQAIRLAFPSFEVLSLRVFEDDQIKQVLEKRVPDKWQECWRRIQEIKGLKNLASRPVMTQIISETLPAILERGHIDHIDSAELYRTYIDAWIEKACAKGELLPNIKNDVLVFIRDLAWEMFRSPTMGTISRPELLDRIENNLGAEALVLGLDQLFVIEKSTGNYAFPHMSFMEYLVAVKIAEDLSLGKDQSLFSCTLTDGVHEFLTDLIHSGSEAQEELLSALIIAQPGEQVNTVIELLTRLGKGNPVEPIADVLATTDRVIGELPQHLVEVLGKEEFLEKISMRLDQESASQVRRFLLELLGSPAIGSDQALKVLKEAIYNKAVSQVSLHAVQVLGKRQGEEGTQTLVEAIAQQEIPVEVRQACVDNIRASSLTDASTRNQVLDVLHQVIGNDKDSVEFRRHCVTKLAEYDFWEALAPLLDVLREFEHDLWLVSASILPRTSVLRLADAIEETIILPNKDSLHLIRQIGYLMDGVKAIRANASSERLGTK
jgi:hypothetical protein